MVLTHLHADHVDGLEGVLAGRSVGAVAIGPLHLPHPGSRFSAPEFLDAVHPRVAVVSVGAGNTYGHPNTGVFQHLTDRGVTVARTDQAGGVRLGDEPWVDHVELKDGPDGDEFHRVL